MDIDIQKFNPNLTSKGNAIRKTWLGITAIRTFHERVETFFVSNVSRYSHTIAKKVVKGSEAYTAAMIELRLPTSEMVTMSIEVRSTLIISRIIVS